MCQYMVVASVNICSRFNKNSDVIIVDKERRPRCLSVHESPFRYAVFMTIVDNRFRVKNQ